MSTDKPTIPTPSASPVLPVAGVLPFEAGKYLEYMEDFEMTDAQKAEFLRVLWEIMATFVRLGFDVDSVLPRFKQASENAPDALEPIIPTHAFNVAGGDGTSNEEE